MRRLAREAAATVVAWGVIATAIPFVLAIVVLGRVDRRRT